MDAVTSEEEGGKVVLEEGFKNLEGSFFLFFFSCIASRHGHWSFIPSQQEELSCVIS